MRSTSSAERSAMDRTSRPRTGNPPENVRSITCIPSHAVWGIGVSGAVISWCKFVRSRSIRPMEQTPQRSAKLALIFPGQGSQHAGMGRRVAEVSPAARDVFSQADEILSLNVTKIVMEGSARDLRKTVNTQPAILAVSWAYLAYLRERAAGLG